MRQQFLCTATTNFPAAYTSTFLREFQFWDVETLHSSFHLSRCVWEIICQFYKVVFGRREISSHLFIIFGYFQEKTTVSSCWLSWVQGGFFFFNNLWANFDKYSWGRIIILLLSVVHETESSFYCFYIV